MGQKQQDGNAMRPAPVIKLLLVLWLLAACATSFLLEFSATGSIMASLPEFIHEIRGMLLSILSAPSVF